MCVCVCVCGLIIEIVIGKLGGFDITEFGGRAVLHCIPAILITSLEWSLMTSDEIIRYLQTQMENWPTLFCGIDAKNRFPL